MRGQISELLLKEEIGKYDLARAQSVQILKQAFSTKSWNRAITKMSYEN